MSYGIISFAATLIAIAIYKVSTFINMCIALLTLTAVDTY